MARRRKLSREERDLWQSVAATTTPLAGAALPPTEPDVAVHRIPAPQAAAPLPLRLPPRAAPEPGGVTLDLAPDPHSGLDRAHPHMDQRRFERLRRGRMHPEARLDLHGMTLERAHAALVGFVLSAHANGLRLVLVITGKGRPVDTADFMARPAGGILRHSLPHWLGAPPLSGKVLQIAPAHQRHGGGGAYYVYLRRQR